MRRLLAHLFGGHPRATVALVAALGALVFFGWRVVDDTLLVSRPPEPDLAPWMSPRFIAKSWNLPTEAIFRIMEIEAGAGRDAVPRTIAEVLERTGLTLEELQRRVEIADEEDRQRRGLRGGERSER